MDTIKQLSDGEICIIPQVKGHAEEMYRLLINPALYEFTDDGPPESVCWLASRYAKLETRKSTDGSQLWLNWVIQRNGADDLIGYVQATVDSGLADVAWVIGASSQGRGYATRATRLMMAELERLGVIGYTCHIKGDHCASNRVAEKLGFQRTQKVEDAEVVWAKQEI